MPDTLRIDQGDASQISKMLSEIRELQPNTWLSDSEMLLEAVRKMLASYTHLRDLRQSQD